MSAIIPFLRNVAFDPSEIKSMSLVLEHVSVALGINGDNQAREIVAARIIELARQGELDPTILRNRVIREANGNLLAMRKAP